MKSNHFLQIFWDNIPVPREITVTYAVIYLIFIHQGIISIIDPGDGMEAFSSITRLALNIALIIAGTLGVASLPYGLWSFEKVALGMIAGVYATHWMWTVGFDPDGDIYWQKADRMILIALGVLFVRYLLIRGRDLDPTKKIKAKQD